MFSPGCQPKHDQESDTVTIRPTEDEVRPITSFVLRVHFEKDLLDID